MTDQPQPEHEDALNELAEKVCEAQEALRAAMREQNPPWAPRDLQKAVRNGWSTSIMSIAFWRLVASGELRVDEQLQAYPGDQPQGGLEPPTHALQERYVPKSYAYLTPKPDSQ